MKQRIVAVATRPESWLGLLLAWVLLSGLRSWHTPWACAAVTESLHWVVGIGLALGVGAGLRRAGPMAQAMTVMLGCLVASVIFTGRSPEGVTGPYGDHQLCASALLALLPFAVAIALAAPRASWRWAGQAVALSAAVCLVLTQTRAAWAGALVGSAVFAWHWLRRCSPSARPLPRLLLPGLLAASVALVFLLFVRGSEIGAPLAVRAATLSALGNDGSWQWRLHTWHGVAQMIARRPLAGWGVGHYPSAHWAFTHLANPLAPALRPSLSDQAHDLYLQTAADLGLIGLGLYLAALAAFARLALKSLSVGGVGQPQRERGPSLQRAALLAASLALIAGQGVDALASPSWQFSEVSLLFWLGLGVGLASTRRSALAETELRLSAPLRRAAQFCAAGCAAILLTAQVLPVGLLSPAEAYYNAPVGGTFQSASLVSSPAYVTAPVYGIGYISFTMYATYLVNGQTETYQVTPDINSFAFKSPGPLFGLITPLNGAVSMPKQGKGETFTVTGTFTDQTGTHRASVLVTIH